MLTAFEEKHRPHSLKLIIDGSEFTWHEQYITGLQIRNLGAIPEYKNIYLVVQKPWEDELVTNDTRVDLARPGIEQFISRDKHHKSHIIVNGRERVWEKHAIDFWEVVLLAFPLAVQNDQSVYTVTFAKGPKENPAGTMSKGDSVFVKDQMVFNVTETNKS